MSGHQTQLAVSNLPPNDLTQLLVSLTQFSQFAGGTTQTYTVCRLDGAAQLFGVVSARQAKVYEE
jgi:hypothetical protein